jgi:hypothetical protein
VHAYRRPMRYVVAVPLLLCALAGPASAHLRPVGSTHSRVWKAGYDECRYLRFGSHWSQSRALKTIRAERESWAIPQAVAGCKAAYR